MHYKRIPAKIPGQTLLLGVLRLGEKNHLEETEPLLWNEKYLQFRNDIKKKKKSQVQEVISNPFQRSGKGPQRFSLVHVSPHLSQILLYVSQFRGWDIRFLGQEENKRNMIIQSLFHYHHSQKRIPPSNRSILDFCGVKLGQQIGWQKLRHQQGWMSLHGKGRVFQAEEKENGRKMRGDGQAWEQRFRICLCFLGPSVSSFFLSARGLLAWWPS